MNSIEEQIADCIKSFKEFEDETTSFVDFALNESALQVERDAKLKFRSSDAESIPGESPRNQTGRLRASITHRLSSDDSGKFAEVGTNVEYGLPLEFGTSKMPAHPFLTPSFEQNKEAIKDYLAKAVIKAANNAGR